MVKVHLPVLPEYAGVVVKPRARDYLVDGERYQRVTTALGIINKPALIPWAKRMVLEQVSNVLLAPEVRSELVVAIEESPGAYEAFVSKVIERASKAPEAARDERADAGTETHRLIQAVVGLVGQDQAEYLKTVPKSSQRAVEEALNFLTDYDIEVVEAERVVWSADSQVAGTIDGVGFRGSELVIWDWKTGAHLYWEAALQLGAYAHLLNNLTGVLVAEAFAVRLPREGDDENYEVKFLSGFDLSRAWDVYKAALLLNRTSRDGLFEVSDA